MASVFGGSWSLLVVCGFLLLFCDLQTVEGDFISDAGAVGGEGL